MNRTFRRLLPLSILSATLAAASIAPVSAAQPLDRIAVAVNDGVILESEIDSAVQQANEQIRSRDITPPAPEVLRKQVLDRLILIKVQTQRAAAAGIRIDDRELNEVLTNLAKENGMTLSQFADALRSEGTDYLTVREQIRDEMAINRIRSREVEGRINVSESDVDLYLAQQDGTANDAEYRLQHILIGLRDGISPEERSAARARIESIRTRIVEGGESFESIAIAESDGQQALDGGDLGMRAAESLPAAFATAAAALEVGGVSEVIEAGGGFHLIKLIERQGGDQRQSVVETRARHILISPNTIRSDEQSRTLARELHQRIVAGEKLSKLAAEFSDDPGSKNNGGDLGYNPPGMMVPTFQERMDALAPGELSEPFSSQFGWHIVEVVDRRTRDVTELAKRARVRNAIKNRRVAEEYDSWSRRLRAEAFVEYRIASDRPPEADGKDAT